MSSHTLEGKKKTQNGVKRLMFTVLSILLEVVFLVGIFKGLNEYAVVIDNMTRIFAVILVLKIYGRNETSSMKTPWIILIPDTADSWSGTLFSDRSERRNLEDADALQKD